MEWKDISNRMGDLKSEMFSLFDGVVVEPPVCGPTGIGVQGALENVMMFVVRKVMSFSSSDKSLASMTNRIWPWFHHL